MKTGSLVACNRDSRGALATRRPVASTTALALALLTGCARDTMPVVSERPSHPLHLGDLPWGVHAIAHPSGQRSDGIEPLPKGTYRATLAVAGVRGCGMARVKFTVE